MIWGAVLGAAVVVAIAGVAKLAKPAVSAEAMRTAGVPVGDGVATALGAFELILAAVVLVWPTPPAAAVLGLLYLGFAGFSARLLWVRGPAVPCGCFGQRDAAIGIEHVVVNLVVAGVLFDAAAGIGPGDTDPVAVIGVTALLLVLLALVPSLRMARR